MFSFITKLFQLRSEKTNVFAKFEYALRDYNSRAFITRKFGANDINFVAVDFETTGLDPKRDNIISMGFCPVKKGAIRLSDCEYVLVKSNLELCSENVAIHGLTDDVIEFGLSPEQALIKFMDQTIGKVVIAHHHKIELGFIQNLAQTVTGCRLPLFFVDTLRFAERQLRKKNREISSAELRLFNLRNEMGLPGYRAHNALEDAIATAELFLAQKAALRRPESQIRLADLAFFKDMPRTFKRK